MIETAIAASATRAFCEKLFTESDFTSHRRLTARGRAARSGKTDIMGEQLGLVWKDAITHENAAIVRQMEEYQEAMIQLASYTDTVLIDKQRVERLKDLVVVGGRAVTVLLVDNMLKLGTMDDVSFDVAYNYTLRVSDIIATELLTVHKKHCEHELIDKHIATFFDIKAGPFRDAVDVFNRCINFLLENKDRTANTAVECDVSAGSHTAYNGRQFRRKQSFPRKWSATVDDQARVVRDNRRVDSLSPGTSPMRVLRPGREGAHKRSRVEQSADVPLPSNSPGVQPSPATPIPITTGERDTLVATGIFTRAVATKLRDALLFKYGDDPIVCGPLTGIPGGGDVTGTREARAGAILSVLYGACSVDETPVRASSVTFVLRLVGMDV